MESKKKTKHMNKTINKKPNQTYKYRDKLMERGEQNMWRLVGDIGFQFWNE